MAHLSMAEIENLLSEKLLNGYVLLESSCPVCSTPLVKNNHMVPKDLVSDGLPTRQISMVKSESFDKQPFKPVPGVPVCVVCQSHVITQECEISILERTDSLKYKGSILVAMQGSSYGDDSLYADYSETAQDNASGTPHHSFEEEKKYDDDDNIMDYTPPPAAPSGDAHDDVVVVPTESEVIWEDDIVQEEEQENELGVAALGTASQPIFVQRPTVLTKPEVIHLELLPSPVNAPMPPSPVDEVKDAVVVNAEPRSQPSISNGTIQPPYSIGSKKSGQDVQMINKVTPRAPPTVPVPEKEEEAAAEVVAKSSTVDDTTVTISVGGSKNEYASVVDFTMEEYSVRREIATKVLGAKMLKGFTLQVTTCDRCGMPQMEKGGKVTCVVCPALAKKVLKKLKAQEHLEEEKSHLEREVQAKKDLERKQRAERLERERLERERLERERLEMEKIERIAQEKREVEERIAREQEAEHLRFAQRRREMEEERARLLALEAEEEARLAHYEAEESRLLEQARYSAMVAAREKELRALESQAKQDEEERLLLDLRKEADERLALERQKQKQEEEALLLEASRLEAYEAKCLASTTEAMKKDLLEQEHRRRLVDKVRLDREIIELEEIRQNEEIEIRRLAEERRAEEESRMIASLEAEAASKALAAEDAIRKAKAALEHVNFTKRSIIAQTIALAEQEAIAETEEVLKAEQEDHKEAIILPSESELHRQRWETLRLEGRAIMTRRVLQGWQLIPQHCEGYECQMSPLITKLGRTECVVCGGTGNGCDGVYASQEEDDDEMVDVGQMDPSLLPPRDVVTRDYELIEPDINDHPALYGDQEEFEEHRDTASKEIGTRLLLGWTLIDSSCPQCGLPLMMDNVGNNDICVFHGHVGQLFDDSTIKTNEMKAAIDNVEDHKVRDQILDVAPIDEKDEESLPDAPSQFHPEQPSVATHSVKTSVHHVLEASGNLEPEQPPFPVEDGLFKMIREQASRLLTLPTPKGDPPAFTTGLSKAVYEHEQIVLSDNESSEEEPHEVAKYEPSGNEDEATSTIPKNFDFANTISTGDDQPDLADTITIPKDFDFTNPNAIKQLMKIAAGEDCEGGNQHGFADTITIPKDFDYTDPDSVKQLMTIAPGEHLNGDDQPDFADTITIPKDFDFNNPNAIKQLMKISAGKDFDGDDQPDQEDEGTIHSGKDGLSREIVTKMFLRSPYGYDFHDLGTDIGIDDIKDLVDIFMATNFDELVTDGFKRDVARDILDKLQPPAVIMPPTPTSPPIIRLEHMPSPGDEGREEYGNGGGPRTPRAFHFDDHADTVSTRSVSRRSRPNPETMMIHSSSRRSDTASRPPMSPTFRLPPRMGGSSRREGDPIFVGGPLSANPRQQQQHHHYGGSRGRHYNNHHHSDNKSIGETSRASSAASEALESIYAKIDQCKATLMDATNTIDDQLAAADLLEKLAKAAVAVRTMERQEQAYE